jgi:hypothetical protein
VSNAETSIVTCQLCGVRAPASDMDLLEDGHRCSVCALTAEVAEHKTVRLGGGAKVLIAIAAAVATMLVLGFAVGLIDTAWGTHYVEVREADGQLHRYGLGGGSGLIYLAMFGIPPLAIVSGVATFFLLGRRRKPPVALPAARLLP